MSRVSVFVASCLFAGVAMPALASNIRLEKALDKLEPFTRVMEVCGIKAGEQLRREKERKSVDRVVMDAMSVPEIEEDVVTGDGGAFRQKGQWYRLTFACRLTEDHLSARSVTFDIGDEIPETKWEEYGLWK